MARPTLSIPLTALMVIALMGQARAQSPCASYGALTLGKGCEDLTFVGCCMDNGDLAWCEGVYVCVLACSKNEPPYNTCGWAAQAEYYDCGQTGADPSGQHPRACPPCTPDCTGKECGNGGCPLSPGACGTCNVCGEECVNGQCVFTACEGKECGDDGCGGSCGTCPPGDVCVGGKCCTPDCTGKQCGHDGCGNPCGTCPAGQACDLVSGTCTSDVPFECQVHDTPGCPGCPCEECVCAMDEWCCDPGWYWDEFCVMECQYYCEGPPCDQFCFPACKGLVCGDDGCGGSCGTCPAGTYCGAGGKACIPCTCQGKQCGDDGCGNSCGTCPNPGDVCVSGVCVPLGCAPRDSPGCEGCACEACVCAMDPFCCNTVWDYYCVQECSVDCGANCPCVPNCQYAECGDDGCGGLCPPGCGAGEYCDNGTCQTCTCEGKECGDDGCGNLCGTCGENEFCNAQGQCIGYYPDSCLGLNQPSAPTCPQGLGYEGCCDGSGRVVWCDGGQLFCIDCAGYGTTCGWLADEGFYDCGQTGPDPSGQFPYDCPFAPCEPDCTGQMCGNGGCPGAGDVCGTCPEGLVCVKGKCLLEGCGGLTFEGCCDGALLKWCEDDEIQTIDCSTNQPPNNVCGWKAEAQFYDCGGSGAEPTGTFPIECPAICEPDCTGMECGNGGCPDYPDILCGKCNAGETCVNGQCEPFCEPSCQGKECGDDGCGGLCPPGCNAGETCVNGQCKPICEPSCQGKECGDDGCGGLCPPGCNAGETCVQGQCCAPNCQGKECGDDGCGGSCGTCPGGKVCNPAGTCECKPNCTGKECGDDGCGGSCGTCGTGETCVAGQCEALPPPDTGARDAFGGDVPSKDGRGGGGGCASGGLGTSPWTFLFLMSGLGAAVLSRQRRR